jgi:hypothetical protein
LGRGVFPGERQPNIVDADNLIGVVDGPDEAALIEGFCHSPTNPVSRRLHNP